MTLRTLGRIAAPLAILAAGGLTMAALMASGEDLPRRRAEPATPTVETLTVRPTSAPLMLEATGRVAPARQVALRPKVDGEVVTLAEDALPGGILCKGTEVLRLDDRDYRLEVAKAESALDKARADLDLEMGEQEVARKGLDLLKDTPLGRVEATELSMRKPQLEQARAEVAVAEADLAQTRLDLEHTVIRAPFNALVLSLDTNLGAQANAGDTLLTLVGTDRYWVEASVPLDRLRAMGLDAVSMLDADVPVEVVSQAGDAAWHGRLLSFTGSLSGDTHMAGILVEVADPLGLKADAATAATGGRAMVLNDFVTLRIQGPEASGIVVLDRALLRDNDTVWVLADGVLDVREVDVAWKHGDSVYVSAGLWDGDAVVTSSIAAPVAGMRLRTEPPVPVPTDSTDHADGGRAPWAVRLPAAPRTAPGPALGPVVAAADAPEAP